MIVRSEYSFRQVFGSIKEVVSRLPPWGGILADDGCWGHVPFAKECARTGRRAVLGHRFKRPGGPLIVVPRSPAGLRTLYSIIGRGEDPARAAADMIRAAEWYGVVQGRSTGIPGALLCYTPGVNSAPGAKPHAGPSRAMLKPTSPGASQGDLFSPPAGRPAGVGFQLASGDNLYPAPGDRQAWELMLGRLARGRGGPQHIMSPDELMLEGAQPEWVERMRRMVEECDTPLPHAENVRYPVPDAHQELVALCTAELNRRGLNHVTYSERLSYELRLIGDKKFADYFLVIWDMIRYAKNHMLVGPARGSSAGSLVCWLLRITEIDPIKHGLIFERFIDVNRMDLPDIDIDFPDSKREMVIEYLRQKYGEHNVANIGTVIRYKAKSALTDVAKQARVPLWELDKLKDVMIERSSGDSRTSLCLADSLEQMEVGRALTEKYPLLKVAPRLEDHARSAGVHAAGWIVCNQPVSHYCGVTEEGVAQVDKKMAESINILKIDGLGLRTLSIVEDACELAGIPRDHMYSLPLNDEATFAIFNERRFAGIFQYEGIALQSVAKQIRIDCFDDVAAITALCRPGPLSGGETTRWILGKNAGKGEALLPALQPYTNETYGTILYQEQVMLITRQLGGFSWADTAKIRKLMSDRKGDEAFGKFEEQFLTGAQKNGTTLQEAQRIWKAINTFGSWAFNKSHAVAYGLLSYWTAWLKAHHPLPFIVAALRHEKGGSGDSLNRSGNTEYRVGAASSAILLLREAIASGIKFTPIDPLRSTHRWEFADGELLGPLTGLPGIGMKTALDIQMRRNNNIALTARQQKLLAGQSGFADHSPTHRLWGDWYAHPELHFVNVRRVWENDELDIVDQHTEVVVIGRLIKKNLRDLNEEKYLVRRGGTRKPDEIRFMLLFHLEDDTGRVLCCINNHRYKELGIKIVEQAPLGQWFAVRGRLPTDFKMLQVEQVKWLNLPSTTTSSAACASTGSAASSTPTASLQASPT